MNRCLVRSELDKKPTQLLKHSLSLYSLTMTELKANDLILFLRPHDPCWDDEEGGFYCLDKLFLDNEGYYCDGYEEATEEECKAQDVFTGTPATELCCGCGGGERLSGDHEEL